MVVFFSYFLAGLGDRGRCAASRGSISTWCIYIILASPIDNFKVIIIYNAVSREHHLEI